MKKLLVVLISCSILLSACGSENTSETPESPASRPPLTMTDTTSNTPEASAQATGTAGTESPKASETPEVIDYDRTGELTVYMYMYTDTGEMGGFSYISAQEYMRLHPNVSIKFDVTYRDAAKYSELINSGSVSGIVDLSQIYSIEADKYLTDLNELMNGDRDFHKEDYYMNVVNAFQRKGTLKTLCTDFVLDGVFSVRKNLSSELLEAFEQAVNMTYFDMVRLFKNYEANEIGDSQVNFGAYFTPLDIFKYADDVIDLNNMRANIDTHDVKSYLEQAKPMKLSTWVTLRPNGPAFSYMSSNSRTVVYDGLFDNNFNEAFHDVYGIYHYGMSEILLFPYKSAAYSEPKQVSTDGGDYLFTPTALYGITESYADKELAWDFLKFMISETEAGTGKYAYEDIGGTVNIKNFEAYYRSKLAFDYDDCKEIMKQTPTVNKETVVEGAVTKLQGFAENVNKTGFFVDRIIINAWPDLYRYLNDEISVDAAASAMQFRIQEQLD